MPILKDIDLAIDIDQVLTALGADPVVIRRRKPAAVLSCESALQTGLPLVRPQVLYKRYAIQKSQSGLIIPESGISIRNPFVLHQLAKADFVFVVLCTIGKELESYASAIAQRDRMLEFSLDAVGTAAIESLANKVCSILETENAAIGLNTTIPLSPGMTGWKTDEGQSLIFNLLDAKRIGVSLSDNLMMNPKKSLTMLIGAGPHIRKAGTTCDYCPKREQCRYRSNDIPQHPAE